MATDWKSLRYEQTGASKDPGSWFYYEDPRGMGKPGKHSDWYPLSWALKAADVASKYGLQFEDVLGSWIAESGSNLDESYENPGHVLINKHMKGLSQTYPEWKTRWAITPSSMTNKELGAYKDILTDYSGYLLSKSINESPGDLVKGLQNYSGTGSNIGYGTSFFGMPKSKINLRNPSNPAYLAQGWDKYLTSTFLRDYMKPGGPLHGISMEQRAQPQAEVGYPDTLSMLMALMP